MRLLSIMLFIAGVALAGCDKDPAELDIVSLDRARAPMLPAGAATSSDTVALDVYVRAGQLRTTLGRRGEFDLRVFVCDAPGGPGSTVPVYFGGEPINDITARQISDRPDMQVLPNAAVPPKVGGCARFAGRDDFVVVSRPVPLPAD